MEKKKTLLLVFTAFMLVGCNPKVKPISTVNSSDDNNSSINSTNASTNSPISSEGNSSVIPSNNTSVNSTTNSTVNWGSQPDGYNPINDYYQTGTYYATVSDSSTGVTLLNQLTTIVSKGLKSTSYNALWTAYKTTDIKPGTTNIIWDMYSNTNFRVGTDQAGSYSTEGDAYNREHTTPKSWFGGSTSSAPGYDIYNVFPTDGKINGNRSNYPYGEVGTLSATAKCNPSTNGCKLGSSKISGYSGTVFEPADEFKGDLARSYFYMCTRYANMIKDNGFSSGEGSAVYKNSFPYLSNYALNLFLKWAKQDPVSDKERKRNEAAYAFQGNRNPFVDHESYLYRIWDPSYLTSAGGENPDNGDDQPVVKNDQEYADEVIALINSIGTVTADSKNKIDAARTAYDKLTSNQKSLVTNYATLQAAETKYQELTTAPKTDQEYADEVIALINDIGTVTLTNNSRIVTARTAYDKLTTTQKSLVTNYATLQEAEAKYEELKASSTTEINEYSFTGFSLKSATSTFKVNNVTWNSTVPTGGTYATAKGLQFTASSFSTLEFSTTEYTLPTNYIELSATTNAGETSKGYNVKCYVGDKLMSQDKTAITPDDSLITFTSDDKVSGTIKFVITTKDTSKSLYFASIKIGC